MLKNILETINEDKSLDYTDNEFQEVLKDITKEHKFKENEIVFCDNINKTTGDGVFYIIDIKKLKYYGFKVSYNILSDDLITKGELLTPKKINLKF